MIFLRLAVLIAGMLMVGSCARQPSAAPVDLVQLPGFSIELPLGVVQKSTALPSAGIHKVALAPRWLAVLPKRLREKAMLDGGTVTVNWHTGEQTPDGQKGLRELLLKGLSEATHAAIETTQVEDERWLAVLRGNRTMAIAGTYCSPGLTVWIVFAPADMSDLEEQGRRIIRSVRCHVGPTVPKAPTVGLTLPPEFGQVDQTDQQMYYSTQGPILLVQSTPNNIVASDALVRVVNGIFGAMLNVPGATLDFQRESVTRRDSHPAALLEARESPGLPPGNIVMVGALYCENVELSYLLMMFGPRSLKEEVRRLTAEADCSGSSSQTIRPANEVFDEACDRSDAQACGNLSDLLESGEIAQSRRTVAELRARACHLGAQTWCSASNQ